MQRRQVTGKRSRRQETPPLHRRGRLLVAVTAAAALTTATCSYETAEIEAPEIPTNAESSSIFASDGTLLTTLRAEENRVSVKLEQEIGRAHV